MREILFRGKRTDNGEWVDGFIVASRENTYPNGFEMITVDGINYDELDSYIPDFISYAVDPSTIGQYTGLKDKNDKMIWEGDIVRYTFDSPDDPTATKNGLKVRTGRIFWSDWRASFAVTAGRNGSASLNNDVACYVRGRQVYEYVRGANTVEVIGNVHDNPELLEK